MLAIQNFQQRLYSQYKKKLSLPARYQYLYGNPVQPHVPLHSKPRPVCLVFPSPPARLGAIKNEADVPLADLPDPFARKSYFDGRRLRSNGSRIDLDNLYLKPLGLRPEQCWLTHLVRVFLFRDEHLAQYRRLDCAWPEWETCSRFETLARQSLAWLTEELALIQPRLVITLGAQTAAVLQDVRGGEAGAALLGGNLQDLWIEEAVYPALHLAGPQMMGQLTATGDSWLRHHWEQHLPDARRVVTQLVG